MTFIGLLALLWQSLFTQWTIPSPGPGAFPSASSVTVSGIGFNSNAFSNHVTVAISVGAAVGTAVVVAISTNQNTSTFITGVTDNAATPNTYTCINNGGLAVCYTYVATAIPVTSGTVTINEANSSNGALARVFGISVAASSPFDTSGTGSGTTLTPSATTTSSLSASDVVVVATQWSTAGVTFSSYGSGYTGLFSSDTANSYPFNMATEWKTQASGATATGGFTLSGTANSAATMIVALKQ
jgi:hypothetical protein